MSSPWDVDRPDQIGVGLRATGHTVEAGLCRPVVLGHMTAPRTGAARILRGHQIEPAASPLELVGKLTAKLAPALIQDGPVQR